MPEDTHPLSELDVIRMELITARAQIIGHEQAALNARAQALQAEEKKLVDALFAAWGVVQTPDDFELDLQAKVLRRKAAPVVAEPPLDPTKTH